MTDDWKEKGKVSIPSQFKPNAVLETQTKYKNGKIQIDRTFYDEEGWMKYQIHSGDHNKPKYHQFGKNKDEPYHKHFYIKTENGIIRNENAQSLNDEDKISNKDILRLVSEDDN